MKTEKVSPSAAEGSFVYYWVQQRECLPLGQVYACLLPIIKQSGSLNSGIHPCNSAYDICKHLMALVASPCRDDDSLHWFKCWWSGYYHHVSRKLSFVSEPGILCLLPASLKQCQANLLACKQGKTSLFLLQFLNLSHPCPRSSA